MKSECILNEEEKLFSEALCFIAGTQQVSVSSVQRKLNIGYNLAACLVMKMEEQKFITPPIYSGKRLVLINKEFKKSIRNLIKHKFFLLWKLII